MSNWKKPVRFFVIGLFSLPLVWALLWVLYFWIGCKTFSFQTITHIFGITTAEEKNIAGLTVQDLKNGELKMTGYCCLDDFTYPYKVQQQINGNKMALKICARNYFVYPWLWSSRPQKGVSPTHFEYLIEIPKQIDLIRYGDDGKILWTKNKNAR